MNRFASGASADSKLVDLFLPLLQTYETRGSGLQQVQTGPSVECMACAHPMEATVSTYAGPGTLSVQQAARQPTQVILLIGKNGLAGNLIYWSTSGVQREALAGTGADSICMLVMFPTPIRLV